MNTSPEKVSSKRQKRLSEWKKNKAKFLRNQGKEYINVNGEFQQKKELKKGCGDFCRMKCTQRISEENRMQIFQNFYKIGNQNLQWAYISNLITCYKKKVCRNSENSRKTESRKYFLSYGKDNKEIREPVCKPMFLNTLSITHQKVETVIRKMHANAGFISPDKRGKRPFSNEHLNRINEIVIIHVNEFPLVESHYCRQRVQKKYIDGEISSVAQMYRLYETWFSENSYDLKLKATIRQYRDTFNKSFDISFYIPKKDQCDLCEKLKNSDDHEKGLMETEYNLHIFSKQKSRELKYIDKQESIDNNNVITATFDFQKILSSPCAEVSTFYYKRKLHAYNFTVFELNSNRASCYVWDETVAKKGAVEVATCLFRFISTKHETSGITKFNFWSDNCGGQNKNKIIFSFYIWIAQKLHVDISHKFLEKGHTQNEGDSVHALIEKCKKNKRIYTPMEWYSVIRNAKKTEPLYDVIEMENEDFLDFKQFASITNWTKNTKNEKVSLSKIKQIKVSKDQNYIFFYKHQFDDDFKEIKVYDENKKCRKGRNVPQDIPKAYTSTFGITEEKHKDLLYMCDQNLVPKVHQRFYRELNSAVGKEYVVTSDNDD